MQEKIVRLLSTYCLNGMRMAGSIHCIPLPYVTCYDMLMDVRTSFILSAQFLVQVGGAKHL